MLSRRLRRRGFDVVLATNGSEGVAMARTETPDLILMDLNMPDLDGWEATRLLKESPDTQHLPIVVLTAHEIPGNRERLIEAGCAEYHTKPVEMPRLLVQIESILKSIRRDS
ncbi:response regulator [Alienimonas californiensis]|nr:response regulator [Alienimonas californiensis]